MYNLEHNKDRKLKKLIAFGAFFVMSHYEILYIIVQRANALVIMLGCNPEKGRNPIRRGRCNAAVADAAGQRVLFIFFSCFYDEPKIPYIYRYMYMDIHISLNNTEF